MTCDTCLFNSKHACVWHDRGLVEVPLCGGVHYVEKPPHMYAPPESRIFPFEKEPEETGG